MRSRGRPEFPRSPENSTLVRRPCSTNSRKMLAEPRMWPASMNVARRPAAGHERNEHPGGRYDDHEQRHGCADGECRGRCQCGLHRAASPPQTLARCKQYPSSTIARSSQRVSSNSAISGVGHTGRFGFALKMAVRVWHRTFSDRLTTAASSVAFYIMLAAIPGIAAVVSVYGLIANPNDVNGASTVLEALLPPGAGQMLNNQLSRIVQSQEHGSASMLGSGAWFVVLLWSANRGIKRFIDALNTIYDQSEERGFSKPYRASPNDQVIIRNLGCGSRAKLEPLRGRRRETSGSRFPDGLPRGAP